MKLKRSFATPSLIPKQSGLWMLLKNASLDITFWGSFSISNHLLLIGRKTILNQ